MLTLKGVFPDSRPIKRKNFIHENVKNLRQMEQCYHSNKGVEEQKFQLQRRDKIGDKCHKTLPQIKLNFQVKKHEEKNVNLVANNKTAKQKGKENKDLHKCIRKLHEKVLSDPNFSCKVANDIDNNTQIQTTFKNQGVQTLDVKQMDDLYSEGIIRYPSKKCVNYSNSLNKNEASQQIDIALGDAASVSSDVEDVQVAAKDSQNKSNLRCPKLYSSKEEINFIKLNKERTSTASRTQFNNNSKNNHLISHRKGVVPKYIRDRKESQEREQKSKAEILNSDCPDGHVPLPDPERKETLSLLKKNYQDYVNELNMMPIKTDTLRAQRRKIEIEKQLNKLEEGIKVFSRPKVYVKINS